MGVGWPTTPSSRGNFTPRPLKDPYVTISRHMALVVPDNESAIACVAGGRRLREREAMSSRRDGIPIRGAASMARVLALLQASLSLLAGLFPVLLENDFSDPVLGVALTIYGIAGAARCMVVGIWITPTHLVVRSWLHTSLIPLKEVRHITTVPYVGGFTLGAHSRPFAMIEVWTEEKRIGLRITISKHRKTRARARELREILGIERPPLGKDRRRHRRYRRQ